MSKKKTLRKGDISHDHSAFSLFIHFLKDVKTIQTEVDGASHIDSIITTDDSSTIICQHKSTTQKNANFLIGNLKIEEARKDIEKAPKEYYEKASKKILSTNAICFLENKIINPGEICVYDKNYQVMVVHFGEEELIRWAISKIDPDPTSKLVNSLNSLFKILIDKIRNMSSDKDILMITKDQFLDVFLMIAISEQFLDATNTKVYEVRKLIEQTNTSIPNELFNIINNIDSGVIRIDDINFSFLDPEEINLKEHFLYIVKEKGEQLMQLRKVLCK